jgi:hypothetical protein
LHMAVESVWQEYTIGRSLDRLQVLCDKASGDEPEQFTRTLSRD